MAANGLKPDSENLRTALRWLDQHGPVTEILIDEASRRHDLSPLETEFLLREFLPASSADDQ